MDARRDGLDGRVMSYYSYITSGAAGARHIVRDNVML
jgi:hypothetical protein